MKTFFAIIVGFVAMANGKLLPNKGLRENKPAHVMFGRALTAEEEGDA